MGNHRQAQGGRRRRRRAAFLAGTMLLTGVVALLVAVVRADVAPPALGPPPAAASPVTPARTVEIPAAGRFAGTWSGRLADPDTTAVDVRLVVDGPGRGLRLDVPALGCTYRGADPVPGDRGTATTELRAEAGGAPSCLESARVRLGAEGDGGPGGRAQRVRYDLVASCAAEQCVPRRATGVLGPR